MALAETPSLGDGPSSMGTAPIEVAVVADDLTGAIDVLAPLSCRPRPATLVLAGSRPPAATVHQGVRGVDADAREVDRATAAHRLAAAASAVCASGAGGLVFAKIDSTLRGHPREIVAAAVAASGRSQVLVCPAVPAQGRVLHDGAVHTSDGRRLDLAAHLAPGWELRDAADDAALDTLAAEVLERMDEIVVAGAAGLAAALARTTGVTPPAGERVGGGPVLVLAGSRHPATVAQVAALVGHGATSVTAPGGVVDRVALVAAVVGGASVIVVHTGDGPDPLELDPGVAARLAHGVVAALAEATELAPLAAVVATGGHTARQFVDALGVAVVDVVGAAGDGIGELTTPAAIAPRLFTKPGGFGTPTALVHLLHPS